MTFLTLHKKGKGRDKFFEAIKTMSMDKQRQIGIAHDISDIGAGIVVVKEQAKKEDAHINLLLALDFEETPLVGSAEKVAALMQAHYNYSPADIRELYKKHGWVGHRQLSKAFFSNFNMNNGRQSSWQKASDFCQKYLGMPTYTGSYTHDITVIPKETPLLLKKF